MSKYKKLLFWLIVIVSWAIAVFSKLKFNGLMYGLDYGLYHPDGTLYTFRTLVFSGNSEAESGIKVANWYATHGFKLKNISPTSLYFENNSNWTIYKSRILYSVLSVPFVLFLGIPGMLVIPALSLLILMIVILSIGFHYKKPMLGLLLSVFLSFSITVDRWMLINSTDSLLTAIFALTVFLLVKFQTNLRVIGLLLLLVVLSSATRFSFLLWLAISFVLFLNKRLKTSLAILLTASAGLLPMFFVDFGNAVLPSANETNLFNKMLHLPYSMFKVGFYEIAELLILDRLLLLILFISIVVSIKNYKSISSQFFIAALIALWITGAINGTIGVNFRYQLPLLPFIAWTILGNLQNSKSVK